MTQNLDGEGEDVMSSQTKYVIRVNRPELDTSGGKDTMNFMHFIHFILDDIRSASLWIPYVIGGSTMLRLVASNDGFLCFRGRQGVPGRDTILVYNPTTPNIWNTLTLPERFEDFLVGIAFDAKLGACKVVVVGRPHRNEGQNEKIMKTFIYNANERTWKRIGDLDMVFLPRRNEPFVFKGLFCWLGWSKTHEKDMVIVFDVENERWNKSIFLEGECSNKPVCLVELEEELCIVTEPDHWELKVWKVYMDERPHEFVKDIPLLLCKDEITDYKFGGKAVLYIGARQGVWVYNIMHETRRREYIMAVHSKWKRTDVSKRECHIFKPSHLRFHGHELRGTPPKTYEEFNNMLLDR